MESKIAGRNINNLRYADDTTLMAESEEELKPLEESERGEWKSWLKAQHSENEDHGIWSHHFMANRWRNSGNSVRLYLGGSKITADGDCSHEIKRRLLLGRKVMTNLDSIFKNRDIDYFVNKDRSSQGYGFSSSHAWMWELDYKESWALKSWCFWTMVLEKTLESPLDCKEIQPVNPKGNKPWILTGKTEAEAEVPILWVPDTKNQLIGKDPDSGKDRRQEEKGMTEDETVGWHHWLNGYEFEQAPGVGEGQGRLACCSPWGCKESDMTEWLNNNNNTCSIVYYR